MKFDHSLRERWTASDNHWSFDMPPGWMQGRSVFGGLTVAAAAGLGQLQVAADRRLRTVNAQLLSPLEPGAVAGQPRILRAGKNVSFVEVRLLQAGCEVAVVELVFARPRKSTLAVTPARRRWRQDPEMLSDLPYVAGITPEFTQHIAFRWARGGLPFSGASEANMAGYCRFRPPSGGVEGALGLLDAWPCPSLALLEAPTPASTVMWTAHLFDVPDTFDGWFAFEYETVVAADGFHTSVGKLYAPDERLVGWTEQLVVVFA